MMDDQILVNRFLKNKSEKAFRALYQQQNPSLYQLALKLTGYETYLSEEVIQETWIVAVQKLGDFRWKSKLRTWLAGILINVVRQKWRKSHQEEPLSISDEEYKGDIFADGFSCTQYDLENALATLSFGYRQIIVLHDIEGYKHKEIAQMLQIQEGTSKSQLFKARGKLKKLLLAYQNTTQNL